MPGKVKKTPYGKVQTDALEQLQGSFNTQQLLSAVDQLDRLRELVTTPAFEMICCACTGWRTPSSMAPQ